MGTTVKQHLTFAVCRITFQPGAQAVFRGGDPSGLSVPNVARKSGEYCGRSMPRPGPSARLLPTSAVDALYECVRQTSVAKRVLQG
jgi:hypothetical protein